LVALLAMLGALAVAGCSRQTNEQTAGADTLRNGVPRALEPRLAGWTRIWRHAVPRFRLDSLRRFPSETFHFDYAWRDTAHELDPVRAHALIDVRSPDSSHSLDFDVYLDFERNESGKIVLGREPDSAPVLADLKSDSLWRVAFCGTPCFFDGAYWADDRRFALTGATRTGAGSNGPWAAFLDVYDLRTRTVTRWLASPVDDHAFDRYRSASDAALIERLEDAGVRKTSESAAMY